MPDPVLSQLITMSRNLGNPALDYAILGEGNTSARIDPDTFWVKASGAELQNIGETGFVRVRFSPVLSLLDAEDLTDEEVKARLESARLDPSATARPSVETVLHAMALQLEGVNFVGHTHPTAVNSILCSKAVESAISGRLFPDEIVYCGPAPAYVPYTDPGVPLARKVYQVTSEYLEQYDAPPKVILMQNHGFIALGKTPAEVENITAMYVKAARVLFGTFSLGGPHFLSPEHVARIHNRPDEHFRRNVWESR